jgi:hypothetical protein
VPISKGPSSKDKAPSLVKKDKGPLTMKHVFHVKPTFKWVKRACYEGPFFGFRPDCGYGSFKLGIGSYQLSGNAPLPSVGDVCSLLMVEPLGRCTAQFCGSQVVLLAVVEDVGRAAQPSPRDFVAVSELVGSPPAMENPSGFV